MQSVAHSICGEKTDKGKISLKGRRRNKSIIIQFEFRILTNP
jgi:hypothetical protein